MGMPGEISVLTGAIAFRVLLEPIYALIRVIMLKLCVESQVY